MPSLNYVALVRDVGDVASFIVKVIALVVPSSLRLVIVVLLMSNWLNTLQSMCSN